MRTCPGSKKIRTTLVTEAPLNRHQQNLKNYKHNTNSQMLQ